MGLVRQSCNLETLVATKVFCFCFWHKPFFRWIGVGGTGERGWLFRL